MNKISLSCGHHAEHDLSMKHSGYVNIVCDKCGMHHYNGKEYTRMEWAEYVEDFSEAK